MAAELEQRLAFGQRLQFHFTVAGDGHDVSWRRNGDGAHHLAGRREELHLRRHQHRRIRSRSLRPFRPGVDPRLDQRNLLRLRFLIILRRHRRLRLAGQHQNHPALVRPPRTHRCSLAPALEQRAVTLQRQLPLSLLIAMTAGAVFCEEGVDLRGVVGDFGGVCDRTATVRQTHDKPTQSVHL